NQYIAAVQSATSETALLAEKVRQSAPEKVPPGLLVLVKQVQANAAFYRVMLGRNGDPAFVDGLRQMSENRYRYLFSQYTTDPNTTVPPTDMKLAYISHASVGALLWWLENDQPCSAEQMAIWLGQLSMTSAGLTGVQRSSTA
ncbi:MAG: TetR/AcrR family transcriptional regulator C-terminal domain-containing protein, partial [Anaerolineae bacterium]|nr:TetR/AcrR family transcriptional regulator C-terminal domain-containing protein [Anaerolineae bacterium]